MAERTLNVSLAALSQTGRRPCNEDAFGYWEGAGSLIAVLCDGAGDMAAARRHRALP